MGSIPDREDPLQEGGGLLGVAGRLSGTVSPFRAVLPCLICLQLRLETMRMV